MTPVDVIGRADHCGNLDGLDVFANASEKELRDQGWLEDVLVHRLGLYPAQGIPQGMWSLNGLGICQYPNQFAPYLIHLSTLGIERYAEIGVWVAGAFATTVEYLTRFGLKKALGIDVLLQDSAKAYADRNPSVGLLESASTSREAQSALKAFRPDLVLIDGDHTYQGAVNDWDLVRPLARWVAFHDIVGYPDVVRLWGEIDRAKLEWTAQYPELEAQAGLGLVEGDAT